MIKKLNSVSLETERLLIRPIEDADVKSVYQIHIDDEVNRYLPYDTWQSWDDAKHWYAKIIQRRVNQEAEQFVIVRTEDQQLIGTSIVFGFNEVDRSCEFGYVLHRKFWRQGYMFEATSSLLTTLMAINEIDAVRAVVDSENKASLALLANLGFTVTARLSESDANDRETYYLRYEF